MTICIAALYGNGKGCIFASDQMVTAHFPIGYEFESDEVEKILTMCPSAPIHALVAGDVLIANQMLTLARKDASEQGITTASGIAELVRKAYQLVRVTTVIHNELEPRGLDLNTYYNSHQRLLPPVIQMIDRAFVEFKAGVELIVAGIDESKCTIYTIINPGLMTCNDPIGYSAVGTGAPHAIYSLIDSEYKKSLGKEDVEKLVRDAKKRSEVAPGVGRETSVIAI